MHLSVLILPDNCNRKTKSEHLIEEAATLDFSYAWTKRLFNVKETSLSYLMRCSPVQISKH